MNPTVFLFMTSYNTCITGLFQLKSVNPLLSKKGHKEICTNTLHKLSHTDLGLSIPVHSLKQIWWNYVLQYCCWEIYWQHSSDGPASINVSFWMTTELLRPDYSKYYILWAGSVCIQRKLSDFEHFEDENLSSFLRYVIFQLSDEWKKICIR